ncbi:MAG TPA: choice-of-anchor P family protein [Phycisphaerae bacterium]|nr:choice-of-anchor P family protein [Phycisphaerae bacterium]
MITRRSLKTGPLALRSWSAVFATSLCLLGAWMAACDIMPVPPPVEPDPFSGRAGIFRATINGVEHSLVDTGPLPAEGGALEESALDANIAGIVTAQILHASVIAEGSKVEAEASVADFDLNVEDHNISLGFFISRASAECQGGQPVVAGSTEIVELVVDGNAVSASGTPNQIYTINDINGVEVGRITINEQVSTIDGDIGDMTVNALHIVIHGKADIVVGNAHADIKCIAAPPPPPPGDDFVTGGGFIDTTPTGSFANFGVAGGTRGGVLFGHLVYIDHGTDLKVKGTGITAYTVVDATTRRIEGPCEINQVAGATFVVEVADNGEPGIDDTFMITLSNGYTATGTLVGGNIQLHDQ